MFFDLTEAHWSLKSVCFVLFLRVLDESERFGRLQISIAPDSK